MGMQVGMKSLKRLGSESFESASGCLPGCSFRFLWSTSRLQSADWEVLGYGHLICSWVLQIFANDLLDRLVVSRESAPCQASIHLILLDSSRTRPAKEFAEGKCHQSHSKISQVLDQSREKHVQKLQMSKIICFSGPLKWSWCLH